MAYNIASLHEFLENMQIKHKFNDESFQRVKSACIVLGGFIQGIYDDTEIQAKKVSQSRMPERVSPGQWKSRVLLAQVPLLTGKISQPGEEQRAVQVTGKAFKKDMPDMRQEVFVGWGT